MSDDYLDGLRAQDRADNWRRGLSTPRPRRHLRVLELNGSVVGFAAFGPVADDPGSTEVGELYAINLDPDVWRQGLGRTLLRDVVATLATDGYPSAVLWVASENARARGLYEAEGWVFDSTERDAEVLGARVHEVRYHRDLTDYP
ncbi:MAG: GNAT family N-acetyltransferase [Actinomycetota bacterium]|nr:GNAT family N-acetyltransferase [Actinomycetota bacterium]